jgi:hypothetical protein
MKSLICLVITGLFVGIAPVHAGQGRGNGNFKVARSTDKRASDVDVVVRASIIWAPREIEVIRAHYAPQYRNLPPGLQKKVARGGSLPPGWQKKMQPFPPSVDRALMPLPSGYSRGVFDGHAVIYNRGVVVDIFAIL